MSFAVNITAIKAVHPIEGADRIEAVQVGDYRSITLKGEYKPGDLVAYIPEGSLVPESLLVEMGLSGKLSGSQKNRVKAVKLRGTLSQGLVYPLSKVQEKSSVPVGWEGDDVSDILGITKYEPPVPTQFNGQLSRPRGDYSLINYDIENIKKWNEVLKPGETVSITEKIHGTLMQAVYWPKTDQFAVSSKGLGARGFIIEDTETNKDNTYVRAANKVGLPEKLRELSKDFGTGHEALFVLGEVYGKGIQDLSYAAEQSFRAFDIYVGLPGQGYYLGTPEFVYSCDSVGIERVPELYRGAFSKEVVHNLTDGFESLSGTRANIREGVVVKPVIERQHNTLGRVILKSVSEAYLLRKDGTEFN